MQHSPEGIEADRRQREFHDEWVRKWLNYYRQCDGYGGHHNTENGASHGAGFWPMDMPVPLVRRIAEQLIDDRRPRLKINYDMLLIIKTLIEAKDRMPLNKAMATEQNGFELFLKHFGK